MMSIPTTISPFFKEIALMPEVALPISLISFSLNFIDWPFFVAIIISLSPELFATFFKKSPCLRFMAIKPDFLTFLNSSKAVRFIIPF